MLGGLLRRIIPERLRPIGYLTELVLQRTQTTVQRGPFVGMRYIDKSVGSAYIPKLLGIYERELWAHVEAIIALSPPVVIDIGAAEGYYAVGLTRRLPQCRTIAFEMNASGRNALARMAELNGVSARLGVRGKCEPDDLAAALGNEPNTAVVCDVEGYEKHLLDPAAVPALRRAAVLVELHDFLVPEITETLKCRFSPTHRITHIWQQPRSRDEFPWRTLGTALLPKSYLDWSVSEWRPVQMAWLWMQPNH